MSILRTREELMQCFLFQPCYVRQIKPHIYYNPIAFMKTNMQTSRYVSTLRYSGQMFVILELWSAFNLIGFRNCTKNPEKQFLLIFIFIFIYRKKPPVSLKHASWCHNITYFDINELIETGFSRTASLIIHSICKTIIHNTPLKHYPLTLPSMFPAVRNTSSHLRLFREKHRSS